MAYVLHGLLADAAARHPQRPAVSSDGCVLSYDELDQLSNKLARALLRLGVAPGDRVGILAPKSAAAVVAVYGALKARACYVPLDPKAPADRISYVAADSGIGVVIADEDRAPQIAELADRVPGLRRLIITANPAACTAISAEPAGPLEGEQAIETDLAYMLYTSGSTGTPKGVMISHRNSLTFVDWSAAAAGLGVDDRVCSPAPLHFDLSVFDVFASCLAGACLVVIPERTTTFPVSIAQWLERERVSVWYSVPSVLTLLACFGGLSQLDLSGLRTVIFAGEVFPPKYLARLRAELPRPRYLNWYGPTETNVVTAFEVMPGQAELGPVPIGTACANTEVFAVTGDGSRVREPGQEGELYVRGPSLMRGYWGRPEQTRRVLVPNPLAPDRDELVYRTGDLVTVDAAGNYLYVGRDDAMVKIRGYRVELGEVEAALYRHPSVAEAAVLPVPDELLGSRLHAVVSGTPGLTRDDVLEHCRRWLPSYMVPEVVEFRAALPRTSTGKVDRVGLATGRDQKPADTPLAETH
jgi:amino acid adenylation domain-containing protein